MDRTAGACLTLRGPRPVRSAYEDLCCNRGLVGKEGLEPSPLAGLEPKSSASTNFATRPRLPKDTEWLVVVCLADHEFAALALLLVALGGAVELVLLHLVGGGKRQHGESARGHWFGELPLAAG